MLIIPLMVAGFPMVRRAYDRIGRVLEIDARPQRPRVAPSVVVVPIIGITRLAEESLSAALSLGDRVVAPHVVLGDEADDRAAAADSP